MLHANIITGGDNYNGNTLSLYKQIRTDGGLLPLRVPRNNKKFKYFPPNAIISAERNLFLIYTKVRSRRWACRRVEVERWEARRKASSEQIRSVRKALAPGEIGRPGEEVSRRQRYPPAARFRLHRLRPLHTEFILFVMYLCEHLFYTCTCPTVLFRKKTYLKKF